MDRNKRVRKEFWFTFFFNVLLTVHLSIFILVINQLDAQNLFYNKFILCLYMFRAPYTHRQEVKIVLYNLWYHDTEKSEWSKVTKIYKYEHIVVKLLLCAHIYIFYILIKYINMST